MSFQPWQIQTASTTSSEVFGPGSSVDGDIVLFSGTTGSQIKDSGINVTGSTITASLTGAASLNTTYTPNQYGLVTSGMANAMDVVAPVASTVQPLISGGTGANPAFAALSGAGLGATAMDALSQFNVGVADSVSAGALTLALKQNDGATDPGAGAGAVGAALRSSTAATGGYTLRTVTAAKSFTISSGTTLGLIANVATYLYIYLIDSDGAGTMKLGASTTDLDMGSLQSSVAESFTATYDHTTSLWTAASHGLLVTDSVQLTAGTSVPTGFSTATQYFIIPSGFTTSAFKLSATPLGAAVTAATNNGTGTQTIHVANNRLVSDAVYTNMPIRLLARLKYNLVTPGTWLVATEKTLSPLTTTSSSLSDWVAFTPTGGLTTNTTYTGLWRRVGTNMEIQVNIAFSGAPGGSNLQNVTIPTGYYFDPSRIISGIATPAQTFGTGFGKAAGAIGYILGVFAGSNQTANTLEILYANNASGTLVQFLNVVAVSAPATLASGDFMNFSASIPIYGWGPS